MKIQGFSLKDGYLELFLVLGEGPTLQNVKLFMRVLNVLNAGKVCPSSNLLF